jgi:hypothetical protein
MIDVTERNFRAQLEIVAEHCEATGLRSGGAIVREVLARIEADRVEIERLTAENERLHAAEQRWIDAVVYYRNLAILCGAKPADMRSDWDRRLCVTGLTLDDDDCGGPRTERCEVNDLWDETERLTAENERLRSVLDLCLTHLANCKRQNHGVAVIAVRAALAGKGE